MFKKKLGIKIVSTESIIKDESKRTLTSRRLEGRRSYHCSQGFHSTTKKLRILLFSRQLPMNPFKSFKTNLLQHQKGFKLTYDTLKQDEKP